MSTTAVRRFHAKIRYERYPGGCWEWQGRLSKSGYGSFSVGVEKHPIDAGYYRNITALAHRFAYEHWVGNIPRELVVDHVCRNRSCVRPDHLELVTPEENGRRVRKSHCCRGHYRIPEQRHILPSGKQAQCPRCAREQSRRWRERSAK